MKFSIQKNSAKRRKLPKSWPSISLSDLYFILAAMSTPWKFNSSPSWQKKTHHGQTKRVKLANLTPSRFATLESRFGKLEEKEENDMKAKNKKLCSYIYPGLYFHMPINSGSLHEQDWQINFHPELIRLWSKTTEPRSKPGFYGLENWEKLHFSKELRGVEARSQRSSRGAGARKSFTGFTGQAGGFPDGTHLHLILNST